MIFSVFCIIFYVLFICYYFILYNFLYIFLGENPILQEEHDNASNDSEDLSAAVDCSARLSYSATNIRTCWNDVHGIQSDVQKLVRLLRKMPERTTAFYTVCIIFSYHIVR